MQNNVFKVMKNSFNIFLMLANGCMHKPTGTVDDESKIRLYNYDIL